MIKTPGNKRSGGSILQIYIYQNLKYNIKGTCIFHLILVGILSILILPIKNRWGRRVLLNRQNLLSVMKVTFVNGPLVSSAKWWNLQNFIDWFRSFIYNKNSRGPKTDPSGTPQFIAARPDLTDIHLIIDTCWLQLDR